ncbi:protein of unknown function [Methylacidimicrobium sp. AP8]|nr:protein of unknown function [Methylacidimicrobium sp. AP8]
MAERFVPVDRMTPMLLPEDLRNWVDEDDLVHFVIEAVERMDLRGFRVNVRGTGDAQYPPSMRLSLLIYCYANGIFEGRRTGSAQGERQRPAPPPSGGEAWGGGASQPDRSREPADAQESERSLGTELPCAGGCRCGRECLGAFGSGERLRQRHRRVGSRRAGHSYGSRSAPCGAGGHRLCQWRTGDTSSDPPIVVGRTPWRILLRRDRR